MSKERFQVIVDVHLILINQQNEILLLKRQNTGYQDGSYHVPAGHMDGNESVTTALRREAKEEIGIHIHPENMRLAHIMHQKSNVERIGFFFEVKKWDGDAQNMEPNKCSNLSWFAFESLPENIVPYAKHAINAYLEGQILSEFGWSDSVHSI